jgi:hypothetical protein
LFQIANARECSNAVVKPRGVAATAPKLIHRNVGSAGAGNDGGLPPGSQSGREELMTAAEQAFLLTGELFVLSFVAIYAFWFADKLRRSFLG